METHFPHLTNGITAPKRVKKRSGLIPMIAAVGATVGAVIYFTG